MGLFSDVVGAVEDAGGAVHRAVHEVTHAAAHAATHELVRGAAHAGSESGLAGVEIRVARDVAMAPADVERALLGKVFGVSGDELHGYAAQLGSLAEQVESLGSKIGAALANSGWTGAAASAFTAVGQRRIAQLHSLAADLKSAAASVRTLAVAF